MTTTDILRADRDRSDLTPEAEAELRELLSHRRDGRFESTDEGRATRHPREAGMAPTRADLIPRDRLQRYLSDLARLGARYGLELEPDIRHRSMRLKPISPEQGGYHAVRLDENFRVLGRYSSGRIWHDPHRWCHWR